MAYFGLVDSSSTLLDRFTVVIPAHTLENQRENLVQYSDGVGVPKNSLPTWKPPLREARSDWSYPVVDFIHLCNWGDAHAEMCFWNYSQAQASDFVRAGNKSIAAFGVALIRCSLDLQKNFLKELYE